MNDIHNLREEAKQEAIKVAAGNLVAELPGAIDRMVAQRDKRLTFIHVAILLTVAMIFFTTGASVVYFSTGSLTCENRPNNTRVCYRWEHNQIPLSHN